MKAGSPPSILFSHPGCPPFAQNAARALHEAGLLRAYATTFAYDPESKLGAGLQKALRPLLANPAKELERRRITEVPAHLIQGHPLPEFIRMGCLKLTKDPIASDRVWEVTEQWFDRAVAKSLPADVAGVYGYEYGVLSTFRAVKRRGGVCIYDQPISHHATTERLLSAEFGQYPETLTSYDRHRRKLAPRRDERKDQELALADLVIAASSFTKRSLVDAGIPEERIAVVPYGAPPVAEAPTSTAKSPFIFLSAGTQSVRKGVHYTVEAWRKLAPGGDVELWLIGAMQLPQRLIDGLPGKVVIRESVPREELYRIYQQSSVLVFPSICEGFGQVITEAMAHHVPVITTVNTAGEDLIQHQRNGLLVPIQDADAVAEAMQWCLDHRESIPDLGKAAAATVANWQWADYRKELGRVVKERLAGAERR